LDALVILSLLAAVALGVFMSLGKSVQARVGAATQKMVGSISHAPVPTQAVAWANQNKFPSFDLLAFDARPALPIAIDDNASLHFERPERLKFFLLEKSKLRKNEHYRTLLDNDPRLVPVAVDPGVSGSDWEKLTLEKRPDGSYLLTGPPKPSPQANNAGGGNAP
jgi:hypothetical protein